jgi:type VI secretion system secreted protein VgrG
MKNNCLMLSGIAAFAVFQPDCRADDSLGSAANFAVLGASAVTSTGDTVLNGDLGVAPGTTITGFGPGLVNGTTYAGGAVAQQAQNDALADYNKLTGLAPSQNLSGQNLGGLTLTPGVYNFSSLAQLTGTLTLNAEGNPNAQFVFQIGSALITAGGAAVVLKNDASALSVSWVIGSSATLGTGTDFIGNVLANQSITLNQGASLSGSAVALNGAVTLDDNDISDDDSISSVPEPNSGFAGTLVVALLGGGGGWAGWRRRRPAGVKV